MSKELECIGQSPREERDAEGSQESPAKEAPPEGSKVLISAALGENSPKSGGNLPQAQTEQRAWHSQSCLPSTGRLGNTNNNLVIKEIVEWSAQGSLSSVAGISYP